MFSTPSTRVGISLRFAPGEDEPRGRQSLKVSNRYRTFDMGEVPRLGSSGDGVRAERCALGVQRGSDEGGGAGRRRQGGSRFFEARHRSARPCT